VETILLSIKPEYVKEILSGTKQYEYRRRLASKPVSKIVIYATDPLMQVVGEVQVLETLSGPPSALWEQTKKYAGICHEKYRLYFAGCGTACAYRLGAVLKYAEPKQLSNFNIHQPPQSFVYISDNIQEHTL